MGLNFSHCEARWGFSGFMRFREMLALEIGIELKKMEGFSEWTAKGDTPGTRSWKNIKDPIVHLLHHSDCDGHLTPKQCKAVAPRLLQLVKDWPDDYDKQQALELAKGMKLAERKGQKLHFH